MTSSHPVMAMPISAQLQTLLTQLQTRYPTSSVSAELITIHQGNYVVRSTVQIGSTLLATAMAAAPEVETAEDQAKIRAMECLRLSGSTAPVTAPVPPVERFLSSSPPLPPVPPVTQQLAPLPEPVQVEAIAAVESTLATTEKPQHPAGTVTDSLPAFDPTQWDAELALIPLPPTTPLSTVELPTAEVPDVETPAGAGSTRSKPEKATRRKADPATPATTEPAVIETLSPERTDRSEEVMKIGIEMKRLGWSTEQGREYLKRTYGKRSRQELDDAELLDFLKYLENQPSPMQTPF